MDNALKKNKQYYWLDLIRGLAALAVFIGHLRIICFQDTPSDQLNLLGKIVFFFTGFIHIAVILFFVLSGFLIIMSIHEAAMRKRWSFSDYSINRLSRLWIVLIPCLFLGWMFDKAGIYFFSDSLFYANKWKYFLNQDIANKLSASIFIGNVFFVQKILVPTLGSNSALWSLAYEFWYYVLFPLFYFVFVRFYQVTTKILFGIAAIALLFFVGKEIVLSFPIWLMGGVSYLLGKKLDDRYIKNKGLLFLFLSLFIVSTVLNRVKFHDEDIFNYYTIGVAFMLLLPFLTQLDMRNTITKKVSTFLSDISYTLYLAHLPFLYLFTAMIGLQGKEWNYKNFWLYMLVVVVTIVYTRLLWFLFERNTPNVKKWLKQKIQPVLPDNSLKKMA